MPPRTYISRAMAAVAGAQLDRRVSFPITDSDIRRWAIAACYPAEPPRVFWDSAYAAKTLYLGIVAPEDFNPFAWMTAEPGGLPDSRDRDPNMMEKILGVAPPTTRFSLNGGLSAYYGVRMRPGDVITSVRTLVGYRERAGRLGLMLLTELEIMWTNQNGDMVREARSTIIRY